MDTRKLEQLCLVCSTPGMEPPENATPLCLTAVPMAEASYDDIERRAIHEYNGLLIAGHPGPNGGFEATLYQISNAGMPVTTGTIATLCGGTAPYFWRTKRLAIAEPADRSTLRDDVVGASVWTSDGAVYSWGRAVEYGGEFTFLGERAGMAASRAISDGLLQEARRVLSEWLNDGGSACAVSSTDAVRYGEEVVDPAAAVAFRSCEGAGELTNEESVSLARYESPLNRSVYFPQGEAYVPITYCPISSAIGDGRSAQFDTQLDAITVFPEAFEWARQAEFPLAAMRYMLAHEFGHARHDIASGTWSAAESAWSAAMGLPAGLAMAIDTTLRAQGLSAECGGTFIQALRTSLGLEFADTYYHSPASKGEFIATLYALDFLVQDRLGFLTPHDREMIVAEIDRYISMTYTTLSSTYTLFPSSAGELANLYWTIALDPQLQPKTRQIGLGVVVEIARALPPEARRYLIAGDPPLRCGTPATLAAFPRRAAPFLKRDNWCNTFERDIAQKPGTPVHVPVPDVILNLR